MKQYFFWAFVAILWASGATPQAHAALTNTSVAKAVGVFFKDTPVMVEIARCESELRQYDALGKALRGGLGGKMIGVFQLHETYHRAEGLARGYNIDSLVGNLAYARDLYRSEGTTPWDSSAHCWRTTPEASAPAIVRASESTSVLGTTLPLQATSRPSTLVTKTLSYGMRDAEVRVLQRVLNEAGYHTTALGEESDYFGIATYKALTRFQCDRELPCRTRPDTLRNVGRVDAATRAVINSIMGTVG